MKKFKNIIIAFFVIMSLLSLFGALDFSINLYKMHQSLNNQLNAAGKIVKKLEFELYLIAKSKSYDSIQNKLRFFKTAEVNKKKYSLIQHILYEEFIIIHNNFESIICSKNEIIYEISMLLPSNIFMKFNAAPTKGAFMENIEITKNFYITYGVNKQIIQFKKKDFIIEAIFKTFFFFIFSSSILIYFLLFYSQSKRDILLKELRQLKKGYKYALDNLQKHKAESKLIDLICNSQNTNLNEASQGVTFCNALQDYFSNKKIKVRCKYEIAENINHLIPIKELYIICSSLVFHKISLCKSQLNLLINCDNKNICIKLEYDAFAISENKIAQYMLQQDITPIFVLKWYNILSKIAYYKIKMTDNQFKDKHVIELKFSHTKLTIKDNICFLDDYR